MTTTESMAPKATASPMVFEHWFSVIAQLLLGCTIFAALFGSPLAPSVKVLIGAVVLLFAVVADALSSDGEYQAHTIMALVQSVPIHVDARMKDPTYNLRLELFNLGREMQRIHSSGVVHVAFRLAKYTIWVGVGGFVGKVVL